MVKELSELLYDNTDLGKYTLDEITESTISFNLPDDPQQWIYVRAQTRDRGSLVTDTGLHVVLRTKTYRPLADELQTDTKTTVSDCLDAMPRKMKRNRVVPSIRGEYLTVKKIRSVEQENGRIRVEKSNTNCSTIPVEFVIESMTYDEVISELIDNSL